MKKYWISLAMRIDVLSLRERAMVFAALVAVVVFGFNGLVLKPQLAEQHQLVDSMQQDRDAIAALQAQIQRVRHRPDPNAANQLRLAEVEEEVRQVKSMIQNVQQGLVSPHQMPALLQDLLRRSPGLRLVSMKTLPVTSLDQSALAGQASEPALQESAQANLIAQSIFRHGVELVVQGSYFDLLQYLDQLESMPWQVYWGKAEMKTQDYPRSSLTLHLYTLSLERSWLHL